MCGLVGLICKTKTFPYHADDLFTNMLRMDTIRGEDSTGVFGITSDGKHDIIKGDTDGHTFVSSINYKKFESKIYQQYCAVIGHNRKATKGTVSPHNAHPFVAKHITLVHNGTIFNQASLNTEVEVDSHAIAHALADHDCVKALSLINGAYALIWYDQKDKTISLARNKERPLYLLEYDAYWAVASEPGLPMWLHSREGYKHKTIQPVPLEKILTFNLKDLKEGPKEVIYEEYKFFSSKSAVVDYPVTGGAPVVDWTPANSLRVRQKGALLSVTADQRIKEVGLKTGDTVIFKAVSYEDPDIKDQTLIGHPIFGNEADGNMLVRAVLDKGQTVLEFMNQGSLFAAHIIHVRPVQGTITYFCRDVHIVHKVTDMNGESHIDLDLKNVLSLGCGRCQAPMTLDDVPSSIVKKKKDGNYRVICASCIETSLRDANIPSLTPETLKLVQ